MRLRATVPPGDYTLSRAYVEVLAPWTGDVYLDRIRAVLAGNTIDCAIGIHQRPAFECNTPSDIDLALSEEYIDDAVPAFVTPVPDLHFHVIPPQVIYVEAGNSFYVTLLAGAGDVEVSGTVDLWVRKL